MKKTYLYLLSLTLIFIIPSLIAGYFVIPYISIPHLIVFILLITTVGSLWDLWATKHGGRDLVWLWMFNSKQTLGITVLGLPIEEYLFYVFSSVYIIFMWEAIGLVLETGNTLYYALIPGLGIWTFVSVFIPYKLGPKNDRIVG